MFFVVVFFLIEYPISWDWLSDWWLCNEMLLLLLLLFWVIQSTSPFYIAHDQFYFMFFDWFDWMNEMKWTNIDQKNDQSKQNKKKPGIIWKKWRWTLHTHTQVVFVVFSWWEFTIKKSEFFLFFCSRYIIWYLMMMKTKTNDFGCSSTLFSYWCSHWWQPINQNQSCVCVCVCRDRLVCFVFSYIHYHHHHHHHLQNAKKKTRKKYNFFLIVYVCVCDFLPIITT